MARFGQLLHRSGILLATLAPALLLALLLVGLAGCQPSVARPQTPPHLLGVVKMPSGHALTSQGVQHSNGLFYVINGSGSVAVLDGPQLLGLITFTVPADFRPDLYEQSRRPNLRAIALNPRDGHVYVADEFVNVVYVISGTRWITTITNVGMAPLLLAVHPQTGYVYVMNVAIAEGVAHSSNIAVVSGTQVITRIHLGLLPLALLINPVDLQVYVGHNTGWEADGQAWGGLLTAISGTHLITTTFLGPPVQGGIYDIAANQHTGEMYLLQNNTVVYWDGKEVVKRLDLGVLDFSLNTLAVDSKRNWAYVASWDTPQSHVLVVQQDQVIATLPVGDDPRAIAVDATHDYVYVANHLSSDLTVIRGTEVVTTLATGGVGTSYITVDEERGYIYVSNPDFGGSVSVFGFDQPADKSAP